MLVSWMDFGGRHDLPKICFERVPYMPHSGRLLLRNKSEKLDTGVAFRHRPAAPELSLGGSILACDLLQRSFGIIWHHSECIDFRQQHSNLKEYTKLLAHQGKA